MAPSGRELLRNSALPATASAKVRPILLGRVVPSPFICEGRQAGLFKRFVADDRPEFQQGDARASDAMGIAGQSAPATPMMPAPTQTPGPASLARSNQSLPEPGCPLQQGVIAKVTPQPEQAKDRAGLAGQQVPFAFRFSSFAILAEPQLDRSFVDQPRLFEHDCCPHRRPADAKSPCVEPE
jgi:hypothetical protein